MTKQKNDVFRDLNNVAKNRSGKINSYSKRNNMVIDKKYYDKYHNSFHGDTYNACACCEGQCEKFKIATLMPGEKEYMAKMLKLSLKQFKNNYLDQLDTPYGQFDVLKMKDKCNLLDDDFHCSAGDYRPVLCDSYPVIFQVKQGKVQFILDKWDCPMVRDWSKDYHIYLDYFRHKGVPALKALRLPSSWWKTVALWDEFDFNYVRIQKELRTTSDYQTFMLEEVLGFACNGYEKSARLQGFKLLEIRINDALKEGMSRLKEPSLEGNRFARLLYVSYRENITDVASTMIEVLKHSLKGAEGKVVLNEENGFNYRLLVIETKETLHRLEKNSSSFFNRLHETVNYTPIKRNRSIQSMREIDRIDPAFLMEGQKESINGLRAYELLNFDDPMAQKAYALLARWFSPDEIDGPELIMRFFSNHYTRPGRISRITVHGSERRLWYRWIMVALVNHQGQVVAAADGAIVASHKTNLFYASHMATLPQLRSKGIGTLLTSQILQAANNHLTDARIALGDCTWNSIDEPYLIHEMAEIEFPDPTPLGTTSMRRLSFHGRAGRAAIWPFRYAQMDTDYRYKKFYTERWNSVPMFLCHRAFHIKARTVDAALEAAELIMDYFSSSADKATAEGVEWDRAKMEKAIEMERDIIGLVPLPVSGDDISRFVKKTGYLHEILSRHYADYKYTLDRSHLNYLLPAEHS